MFGELEVLCIDGVVGAGRAQTQIPRYLILWKDGSGTGPLQKQFQKLVRSFIYVPGSAAFVLWSFTSGQAVVLWRCATVRAFQDLAGAHLVMLLG